MVMPYANSFVVMTKQKHEIVLSHAFFVTRTFFERENGIVSVKEDISDRIGHPPFDTTELEEHEVERKLH
jgi:hypothetical protein